jgi:TPR repeat protein
MQPTGATPSLSLSWDFLSITETTASKISRRPPHGTPKQLIRATNWQKSIFCSSTFLGQAQSQQPETVVARLQKLAEQGDSEARNNLGLCRQYGYGTPQDYQEAAKWFRRAAESGLATGQFNLGGLYYEG